LAVLALVCSVGVAACGGDDGPSRLSEDDFVDELNDLCADVGDELDAIELPEDNEAAVDFADEVGEIYADAREQLGELRPPEDLQEDYEAFVETVDRQIETLGDLRTAAEDDDDDEVADLFDELIEAGEEQDELALDLDAPECSSTSDEPTDTTPDTTPDSAPGTTEGTTPETVPATTAAPTTTRPPLTLPPTLPPQTVPATLPPETTALPADGFDVVDLTAIFNAPAGTQLVRSEPAAEQTFVEIIRAVPALATNLSEMGVAAIVDDVGPIASLVVGITVDESVGMPAEWKNILCDPSVAVLRETEGGYVGVYCEGAPDSGLVSIFTIAEGDVGFSFAQLDPDIPINLIVDEFFAAN